MRTVRSTFDAFRMRAARRPDPCIGASATCSSWPSPWRFLGNSKWPHILQRVGPATGRGCVNSIIAGMLGKQHMFTVCIKELFGRRFTGSL